MQDEQVGSVLAVERHWTRWMRKKADRRLGELGMEDVEDLALAMTRKSGDLAQAVRDHRQSKERGGVPMLIAQEAASMGALALETITSICHEYPAMAAELTTFVAEAYK